MAFQMVRTDPVINQSNSVFTVIVNNIQYTCRLTIGNTSSVTDLVANVQQALQSMIIPGSPSWSVTASTLGFLTITCNVAFSIVVTEAVSVLLGIKGAPPPAHIPNAGFQRGAGTAASVSNPAGGFMIVAQCQTNLNGDPYVLLFVNEYYPSVSASSLMETAFLMIPLENTTYNTRFLLSNDLKEKKNVYVLGPSQSKIDNLQIRLTRPDGSLYATNGIDHQIVFRVTARDSTNFNITA
jgi:hypothetical protein